MAIYSGGLANNWTLKEIEPMSFKEQLFYYILTFSVSQCYHCLSKVLPAPHQAKCAEPLQCLPSTR